MPDPTANVWNAQDVLLFPDSWVIRESSVMLVASRRVCAAAIFTSLFAYNSPASANIYLLTSADLTGQGVGAANTLLTLDTKNGQTTSESGSVTYNGTDLTATGDAKTGANQVGSFTYSSLGISSASQLALIVNLSEPNSESPPSVSLAANSLLLNVYSSSGTLLTTFTNADPYTLNQVKGGVGGSGLVFALDSTQAGTLDSLYANAVFTVGATFGSANGGLDLVQAGTIAAVPEIATWAMMCVGFAGLGLLAYRRRPSTFRTT